MCPYGKLEFGECERMNNVDLNSCPVLAGQEMPVSNKRIIAGSTCKDSTGALGGDTFHVGGGGACQVINTRFEPAFLQ